VSTNKGQRVHVSFDDDDPARQIFNTTGEFIHANPDPEGRLNHWVLNNIPFFAWDYALGDVVLVTGITTEVLECEHGANCPYCKAPEVLEVVEATGHQTALLMFQTHLTDEERKTIGLKIRARGAMTEWASAHLLAFDISPDKTIHELVGEWLDNGWAECSHEDDNAEEA
jgi:hypothetical protein